MTNQGIAHASTPAEGHEPTPEKRLEVVRASTAFGESSLVAALRAGMPRAYRDLDRRERDYIYGICMGMLGCATEAEDISQQVFLKVFQNIAKFEQRARLRTWMHRIALNLCKNRLTRRVRRLSSRTVPLEKTSEQNWRIESPAANVCPERRYHFRELKHRLQDALDSIEPHYARLIRQRSVEGCSYAEMAESMAVSIGTVKSRLHRARRALSRALGDH